LRIDLQPDDADLGAHDAKPRREFQRRDRQRPVTEVDDERIGG
jgi:hypothetical protein